MAAWVCGGCGSAYSVGAPQCPHCGRTDYTEDSLLEDAPEVVPGPPAAAPATTPGPGSTQPGNSPESSAPDDGGVPSAGISSSTSESRPDRSSTTTPSGPLSPAPTTESPSQTPLLSKPPADVSSSAGSTDGSTPATGSGPSGSDLGPPPLRAPKAEWVEHAVTAGVVPPDEVADMTKAEIVEQVTAPAEGDGS